MAEEFEKYAVLTSMFRRRSSTEFTQGKFNQIVDEKQLGNLLEQMGAHPGKEELQEAIRKANPDNSEGKLTFEQYTKVCENFVKDPMAISEAMEFKQLNDFET